MNLGVLEISRSSQILTLMQSRLFLKSSSNPKQLLSLDGLSLELQLDKNLLLVVAQTCLVVTIPSLRALLLRRPTKIWLIMLALSLLLICGSLTPSMELTLSTLLLILRSTVTIVLVLILVWSVVFQTGKKVLEKWVSMHLIVIVNSLSWSAVVWIKLVPMNHLVSRTWESSLMVALVPYAKPLFQTLKVAAKLPLKIGLIPVPSKLPAQSKIAKTNTTWVDSTVMFKRKLHHCHLIKECVCSSLWLNREHGILTLTWDSWSMMLMLFLKLNNSWQLAHTAQLDRTKFGMSFWMLLTSKTYSNWDSSLSTLEATLNSQWRISSSTHTTLKTRKSLLMISLLIYKLVLKTGMLLETIQVILLQFVELLNSLVDTMFSVSRPLLLESLIICLDIHSWKSLSDCTSSILGIMNTCQYGLMVNSSRSTRRLMPVQEASTFVVLQMLWKKLLSSRLLFLIVTVQ